MSSIDPRPAVIEKRLSGARRILAVTGGKGGIGKSMVASLAALSLAQQGKRVGLLDLDFTGPCDHQILGMESKIPHEDYGIQPTLQHGIAFLSVTYFIGEDPAPLRGSDVSSALIELLAITQWGELDVLVIDMPPGIGDATLDLLRFLRRAEFLAVSTASRIVRDTVRRTLRFLQGSDANLVGLLHNMSRGESQDLAELAKDFGLPLLGDMPQDDSLEAALGSPESLLSCPAYLALDQVLRTRYTSC